MPFIKNFELGLRIFFSLLKWLFLSSKESVLKSNFLFVSDLISVSLIMLYDILTYLPSMAADTS